MTLRIAIAQINSAVGDLEGNRDKIISYTKKAKEYNSDIVVFPELALCGYPPEDLLYKRHFVKDNIKALNSAAKAIKGITAIVGFVDSDEGNIYNAAAVIQGGRLRGVYQKIDLPNYGVFDEKRYFTPGRRNYVFKLGNVTFGVNICEDIWNTYNPYREQSRGGAGLLINISASPYHVGKHRLREKMLAGRARQSGSFVSYANMVGGQDELVFDGASFVFDPKGEIVARGKQFEEDLIMASLNIGPASKRRRSASDKGVGLIELTPAKNIFGRKKIPKHMPQRLGRLEEIYGALALGARDYIGKNGFKKVIIGISGGIDSALTAAIACDAIGRKNVIGASMPSQYSSSQTQSDARALADNLGIKLIVVPIDNIFSVYLKALEDEFSDCAPDVTEENLQARIRGNILMAFSNKFGWLVLTTGNKSETSVGYCTLYGDMAGGFAVIKDVPKTLVYKLSRFRNEKESRELIPKGIFTREPSAELKHGQKDRDSLPAYSILDKILKAYVENDMSSGRIIGKKFNSKLVKNIFRMVDRNEYKRRQAPPGVKISLKAFGKDRRFPITNKYRGF